jgi:hypothetical protein
MAFAAKHAIVLRNPPPNSNGNGEKKSEKLII